MKQYIQRSRGSADAITGCARERACALAWRFGEESQHNVTPQAWHVRRCTHGEPTFTHSSHSRARGLFTVPTAAMWTQEGVDMLSTG